MKKIMIALMLTVIAGVAEANGVAGHGGGHGGGHASGHASVAHVTAASHLVAHGSDNQSNNTTELKEMTTTQKFIVAGICFLFLGSYVNILND